MRGVASGDIGGFNSKSSLERRVALYFECGDIEEANYYSDAYESSINGSGLVTIYSGAEMVGESSYGFSESAAEIDFEFFENPSGQYEVDESGDFD